MGQCGTVQETREQQEIKQRNMSRELLKDQEAHPQEEFEIEEFDVPSAIYRDREEAEAREAEARERRNRSAERIVGLLDEEAKGYFTITDLLAACDHVGYEEAAVALGVLHPADSTVLLDDGVDLLPIIERKLERLFSENTEMDAEFLAIRVLANCEDCFNLEGLCLDLQRVASGVAADTGCQLIEIKLKHEQGLETCDVPLNTLVHASVRCKLGLREEITVTISFGGQEVANDDTFAALGTEDGSEFTVQWGRDLSFVPALLKGWSAAALGTAALRCSRRLAT